MQLSREAVTHMLAIQQAEQQQFKVQLTSIVKRSIGNYFTFQISDGQNTCKGFIELDHPQKDLSHFIKHKTQKLNILVKAHSTYYSQGKNFIIEIVQFSILSLKQVINSVKKQSQSISPLLREDHRDLSTDKKMKSIKYESEDVQTPKYVKLQSRKSIKNCKAANQSREKITPYELNQIDIKGFQKISDLYQSCYGWEILVRVIDCQFRDFVSKAGKPTKILTLQLIDKAGDIIQATFFNQFAEIYHERLQKGKVLRMSKGSIKQDKIKAKQGPKYSKYSIVFGRDCSIVEVQDVNSIPICHNNWSRLSQVLQHFNPLQHYSLVAMVLYVEQQKTIVKEGRQVVMQWMQVGDPITYNYMKVVIWNPQANLDLFELRDKSVLLKHFKANRYKDEINLSTTCRSDITLHPFFEAYEGKFKVSFPSSHFQKTKNIKQLNQQLFDMGQSGLLSNLVLWISSINVDSKWYYDACPNPNCRKSALSYSKCPHCLLQIAQCQRKFKLNVQLCDWTGGLWVTAFDDVARTLLKEATIDRMLQLQKNSELKQYVQRRMYDCFRVSICSKKDINGRVKHNLVGKVAQLQMDKATIANLDSIKQMLCDCQF